MTLEIKKYRTIFSCFVVSLLLILSLINSSVNIVTLLVASFIILTWDVEEAFCLMLYIISFDRIFKLQLGGFALINLLFLLFLIRLLINQRFKIDYKMAIPLFVFFIYSIFISVNTGLIDCITIFITIFLGMMLLCFKDEVFNVCRLVEYTSAGLVVSSVIALFNSYFPRLSLVLGSSRIKLGAGLYYYRFAGLQSNPNYYTVLISVVLAVFVVMFIYKKFRFLDGLYFITLLIFGLMSSSMSFVVSFLALGALMFIALFRKNMKFIFFGLLAVIITGIVVYALRNTDFVSTVIYRAKSISDSDDINASSLTSGRSALWLMYVEYLTSDLKSLILGVGIGADAYSIVGYQSHNYFIEIVFYTGLIGAVLYVWSMISIFGPKQYCKYKISPVLYIPLLIFLLRGFARCLFADEQLVFMILLCVITVIYFTNTTEHEMESDSSVLKAESDSTVKKTLSEDKKNNKHNSISELFNEK